MSNSEHNILIIDDNEGDVKLIEEAIKNTLVENNVHIFQDGDEALNFLYRKKGYEEATQPDLILLDLNMPNMDGFEMLSIIKNNDDLKMIPVIILTTSSDTKDIKRCYKLQANCYIVKPVNFMKFKKIISVISDYWLGIAKLP